MRTGRKSLTSKQERINAIREHVHSQISYGSGYGDAIKTIVDGLTDMLLVLAEDDHEEIAKRMVKEVFYRSTIVPAFDVDHLGRAIPRE